jgi:hypothetical protein
VAGFDTLAAGAPDALPELGHFSLQRSGEEDSASGKLVEGILASIAEFYSANLGQEIRKGLDQKAAQGGWPARAPFGYRNFRRDGPGRRGESVLEPDHQSSLVVWAFERYATGELSLDRLTDSLAEKGLRNSLGNPPGKSAVHRMLRNPVYAGIVRWRGVEREGTHTPLVSCDLFDKVQGVLDAHSTGGERSWKHDHYLKGTLVCAECGSRLYYTVAKGRFGYFRCIGRNTGRTSCSQSRYIPAADLEREVEALYEAVRVPRALRRRLERVLRTEVAERERHRAESAGFLAKRLRQLAGERDKLLRAYYADAIDVATLKREQTGSTLSWPRPSRSSPPTARSWRRRSRSSTSHSTSRRTARRATGRRGRRFAGCGTAPSSRRSSFATAGSPTSRTRSPSRPCSAHTTAR